jgi:hypothetical protein
MSYCYLKVCAEHRNVCFGCKKESETTIYPIKVCSKCQNTISISKCCFDGCDKPFVQNAYLCYECGPKYRDCFFCPQVHAEKTPKEEPAPTEKAEEAPKEESEPVPNESPVEKPKDGAKDENCLI